MTRASIAFILSLLPISALGNQVYGNSDVMRSCLSASSYFVAIGRAAKAASEGRTSDAISVYKSLAVQKLEADIFFWLAGPRARAALADKEFGKTSAEAALAKCFPAGTPYQQACEASFNTDLLQAFTTDLIESCHLDYTVED